MHNLSEEKLPVGLPFRSILERQTDQRRNPDTADLERKGHYLADPSRARRKKIARYALAGVSLITSTVALTDGVLIADGLHEQYLLAQTKPSVIEISEHTPRDVTDTATIVALGFGGLTGEDVADQLGPELSKLGHVWALKYDDKGIGIRRLTEVIAEKAKQEHVKKLNFYGISIGGDIEMSIAKDIITGDYGITDIPSFIMDSTPDSTKNLRPEYSSEGAAQTWLHHTFPLESKGKFARWAVEMWLQRNRYTGDHVHQTFNPNMPMLPAAYATSRGIIDNTINSPKAASNQLLNSTFLQLATIEPGELIHDIAKFEKDHGRAKTDWTYVGGPHDYIVDTEASSKIFRKYIRKEGFKDLNISIVPGIVHGNPLATPDLYKNIMDHIIPSISSSIYTENKIILQKNKLAEADGSSASQE